MLPSTRESGAHRIQVIAWRRGLQIGLRHGNPAHRCLSGILAWRRSSLSGLRHGDLAYKHLSGIPAWRRESYDRSSARRHCPKVPQWQHRVAKRASIGTLVRGPSTEALLGQGRVAKERKSVPLTGLWSGSRPGLARHPRLQVVLRHPAWRRGHLSALRHGDPSHRYLRAILTWRTASRPVHDRQLSNALAGLRHGNPAHRCLRAIPAWRRGLL